jgi:protein-tyrosine phosphatase
MDEQVDEAIETVYLTRQKLENSSRLGLSPEIRHQSTNSGHSPVINEHRHRTWAIEKPSIAIHKSYRGAADDRVASGTRSIPRVAMRCLFRVCVLLLSVSALFNVCSGAVSEAHVERMDSSHLMVTWGSAVPVDIYVGDVPELVIAHAEVLSAGNRDGRYVATQVGDRRPYFLLRDTRDGSLTRVAERVLPLEHGSNFRDLGGYAAANGKHVRWGLIYRSAATPLLSPADLAYIGSLGLRSTVDLRSTDERRLAPSSLIEQRVQYIAIDYPFNKIQGGYYDILTALSPQFRAIFRELLSRHGPISFSCTAGQDRTGIAAALILSSLEVPRPEILEDYDLSTASRRPKYEVPLIDPAKYPGNAVAMMLAGARKEKPSPLYGADGRSSLASLLDQIDAHWGSVESYLQHELNISAADLQTLRDAYLE